MARVRRSYHGAAAAARVHLALGSRTLVLPPSLLTRELLRLRQRSAVAVAYCKRGTGQMKINGKDVSEYFARPVLQMILAQPFETAERVGEFDVVATVRGGGLSGQSGAVRHGISRALTLFEPGLRPVLKAGGFLTRDPRVVERKKYGKAKARRSFQFSKR